MPTILIAHAFCAFRDTQGFPWMLLINTGIIFFGPFKTMRRKQNSASAHGIQKKIRDNHAFFGDNNNNYY